MFYGFGSLSKNVVINLSKQNLFKVMAASCLFLTASFIYLMSPDLPEFAVNNMASIWIYPAAFCGALFMCTFAMVLERITNNIVIAVKSFIIYIGKNSYIVLAFHQSTTWQNWYIPERRFATNCNVADIGSTHIYDS